MQLDVDMFNEMVSLDADRWGHVEELLVSLNRSVDMLLKAFVMANRDPKKPAPRLGEPFSYSRPGSKSTSEPSSVMVMRPSDLARQMMGR